MKQFSAVLTGIILLYSGACTQQADIDYEKKAIAAVRTAFWKAHEDGDPKQLADLMTRNAVLWAPGMEEVRGPDPIQAVAENLFSSLTYSDFMIESRELWVHPPYAYEIATYTETMTPVGGQPEENRGRYMIVWKKDPKGLWRVHRNMFHFISGRF